MEQAWRYGVVRLSSCAEQTQKDDAARDGQTRPRFTGPVGYGYLNVGKLVLNPLSTAATTGEFFTAPLPVGVQ